MAAELGQTELFAVVGAEFDSHDVGCGGMWTQKSQTVIGLACVCCWVVLPYAACADTGASMGASSASLRFVAVIHPGEPRRAVSSS